MTSNERRLEYLLGEICSQFGFCDANRSPERFAPLVGDVERFTDEVFRCEGHDPSADEALRGKVKQLVEQSFATWPSVGGA